MRTQIGILGLVLMAAGLLAVPAGALADYAEMHGALDTCMASQPPTGVDDRYEDGGLAGWEHGYWPLGPTCRWNMLDGSTTSLPAGDWSATLGVYGGPAVALLGFGLLLATSRRRPAVATSADPG